MLTVQGNSTDWQGQPLDLSPNQQAASDSLPPSGWILSSLNLATKAYSGQLAVTWSGQDLTLIDVPALTNTAVISELHGTGQMRVSNISDQAVVEVAIYGPGFGNPDPLPADGSTLPLDLKQARQTNSGMDYMHLVLNSEKGYTRIVFIVGAQVKIACLNQPTPAPDDCDADTSSTGNQVSLINNWEGKTLYLVNLSAGTSNQASVSLLAL